MEDAAEFVAVFGVFRSVAGCLFRISAGNQTAHGMADNQKLFGLAFFQSVIDAAVSGSRWRV